jgi:FkbM family methyltransferase
LQPGRTFCDAGAHVGYFSLLAAALVGPTGRVHAFEPTPSTFGLLAENTRRHPNISAVPCAATDADTVLPFHEFPVLFSEYNSLGPPTGKSAAWLAAHPPRVREVRGIRLDDYFARMNTRPDICKIDVEGAEPQVLKGMGNLLDTDSPPLLVMEYHRSGGQDKAHREAVDFARRKGFRTYLIHTDGCLREVSDIGASMQERQLDSDNIVLSKGGDNDLSPDRNGAGPAQYGPASLP